MHHHRRPIRFEKGQKKNSPDSRIYQRSLAKLHGSLPRYLFPTSALLRLACREALRETDAASCRRRARPRGGVMDTHRSPLTFAEDVRAHVPRPGHSRVLRSQGNMLGRASPTVGGTWRPRRVRYKAAPLSLRAGGEESRSDAASSLSTRAPPQWWRETSRAPLNSSKSF